MLGASMWNERYVDAFAAYGTQPNDFVRAVAGAIPEGPVLVIAAGEGRDAVFLAERGHAVTAMDQSEVGLANAATLAARRQVELVTVVADLAEFELGTARWAGIVSVWAHVPPDLRRKLHQASVRALKPGGAFVMEIYAPAHLDRPGTGGPPDAALLLTSDAARQELAGLDFVLCQQVQREVAEGRYHHGPSTTTQVLAFRP